MQTLEPPGPVAALRLDDLAPDDPWRELRWALLAAYGLVFAISVEVNGLPVARLAVLGWVAAAFVVGNVGRPLHEQQRMVTDLVLYAAMWLSYDFSRGIADTLGMPLQVQAPRNIDRVLFLGTDTNRWMQDRFFVAGDVRWYDVVGSLVYFSHFFVPVAASVLLWIRYRPEWLRYIRRFASVLFAGVATYALLPTAPPWMAASDDFRYRIMEPLARPTGNGWAELGLKSVKIVLLKGQQWANPTAAMPSLHAAFALFVVVFFWPFVRHPLLRVPMVMFPLAMALTLVYFGEHYVVDVLAGWAYVGVSFWAWGRWEQRRRTRRADDARRSLAEASPDDDAASPAPIRPRRRLVHRRVVVDATTLTAALDSTATQHTAVRREMEALIAAAEADAVRIVTHSDAVMATIDALARRGGIERPDEMVLRLAAGFEVEVLHPDLVEDARQITRTAAEEGAQLDLRSALTIELARRHGAAEVLSLDPAIDQVALTRVALQSSPA